MNRKRKTNYARFGAYLSPDEKEALAALSDLYGCSMGQVMRTLIRQAAAQGPKREMMVLEPILPGDAARVRAMQDILNDELDMDQQ